MGTSPTSSSSEFCRFEIKSRKWENREGLTFPDLPSPFMAHRETIARSSHSNVYIVNRLVWNSSAFSETLQPKSAILKRLIGRQAAIFHAFPI